MDTHLPREDGNRWVTTTRHQSHPRNSHFTINMDIVKCHQRPASYVSDRSYHCMDPNEDWDADDPSSFSGYFDDNPEDIPFQAELWLSARKRKVCLGLRPRTSKHTADDGLEYGSKATSHAQNACCHHSTDSRERRNVAPRESLTERRSTASLLQRSILRFRHHEDTHRNTLHRP